ncbi:MAG TPA: hypothetical protein PLW88_02185 [Syntrophorhabdaceae bacterium]|nr:hypothetical protein [Syntrophorhabdaceae bacterium]
MEEIVSKSITAFCPPGGNYRKKHLQMAKREGIVFLRTTGYMRIKAIKSDSREDR